MRKALTQVEADLPFRILSLQSDCGTEFLNYAIMRYLQNRPRPVLMTRSRPYRQNDNAHVEQRNFTHVRALFGYERVDSETLLGLMNEIYRDYCNPPQNYFLPSMKLREKEWNAARITKGYDKPKTPCQRLMEAPNITDAQKMAISQKLCSMNPFDLKRGLQQKLQIFFSLLKRANLQQKAAWLYGLWHRKARYTLFLNQYD